MRLLAIVVVLALAGCQQHDEEHHAAAQPQAVAPVEVTPVQQPTDEVAELRARVAELEQQLAACQGTQASTETSAPQTAPVPAVVPQGVDVPGGSTTPAQPATNANAATPDAGTHRRRRDPSLIDEVLGNDAPHRRREGDHDVIELPDPTGLLGR